MPDMETSGRRPAHNVIMENRRRMSLSGVADVDSFDEGTVVAATELGDITIKGSGLHIARFDQDSGELELDGVINELLYSEMKEERKGLFAKLFR